MSILDKLIEIICLAEEVDKETLDESILNEKITTKKALRRKRRAARKAAKRAEQQAAEQQKQEPQEVEAEVVEDEPTENNDFQALVVYDESKTQDDRDFSQAFQQFMEVYNKLLVYYQGEWEKAAKMWESAGKDKPCPEEAYNFLIELLNKAQTDFKDLTDNQFPKVSEQMELEEVEYVEQQLTAINGWLEKKSQLVNSIEPTNLPELADQADEEDPEQVLLAEPDDAKQARKQKDDKRTKKEILTYEKWAKGNSKLDKAFNAIVDCSKKLANMNFGQFVKSMANGIGDWFTDVIWNTLTSPLANDIVKAIMYCNPITAALFNGYITNFGIKDGLSRVKQEREKKRAERDKELQDSKHDKLGLPNAVDDNMSMRKLKKEFYGNKDFVNLVNLCYNHTEVSKSDKADLKGYVKSCIKNITKDERKAAIDDYKNILKVAKEIAATQGWDSKNIVMKNLDKWLHNKGTNQAEEDAINKKSEESEKKKRDRQVDAKAQEYIEKYKDYYLRKGLTPEQIEAKAKTWAENEVK